MSDLYQHSTVRLETVVISRGRRSRLMGTPQIIETPTPTDVTLTQTPDTNGKDENGDGVPGGQTTADVTGDVLGI